MATSVAGYAERTTEVVTTNSITGIAAQSTSGSSVEHSRLNGECHSFQLLTNPITGVEGHYRILVDAGFAEVDSHRSVCQYRFARPYLHHVWAKYPQDEEPRRVWSGLLADELERLYYPLSHLIGEKLFDLFETAGWRQRAERYRRRRGVESSLERLLWHVRFLMGTAEEDDRFGTYRLFDRGFELCDRLVEEQPGLWEEGYRIAEELRRRAELVGDIERQGDGCYYMAQHLDDGGRCAESLAVGRECVRLYGESSGPESAKVARGLCLVGGVLMEQGDLEGARAAFERALGIWEAAYGGEHPQVAMAHKNLGHVLDGLGDLEGARGCFERGLAIRERVYGREHADVATDVNDLGRVLRKLEDLEGARAAHERVFGPDHPKVAIRVNNLGSVLQDLGDLKGARAAYERALAIDERVFGPEHSNVARDVNNLGSVLRAQGDLAGARGCFERALGILERCLPEGHPRTELVRRNLQSLGE